MATPHEFYLGMLLDDADFFEKQRPHLMKRYGDDRLNRILDLMKRTSSDNHFQAIYQEEKSLCAFAMSLANYVAQHKINQKEKKNE